MFITCLQEMIRMLWCFHQREVVMIQVTVKRWNSYRFSLLKGGITRDEADMVERKRGLPDLPPFLL